MQNNTVQAGRDQAFSFAVQYLYGKWEVNA